VDNEQLKQKNAELVQDLAELKDLQVNTGAELSACIAERDTIQGRYQTLEAETADVVAINRKMDATEKEIEEVRSILAAVQQQNSELKRKSALAWFLAGGGVLLFGWILGMFTGRSRKRKATLL
jgi:SH3 domain protein